MTNKVEKVILHHAWTGDTKESQFSAKDIDRWHKEKGWKGIGYHFYIDRNGKLERGRDVNEVGAHTKGQNDSSIGVCLEGKWSWTMPQVISLIMLYRMIRDIHNLTFNDWFCHNDFAEKEGPGFDRATLRMFLSKIA